MTILNTAVPYILGEVVEIIIIAVYLKVKLNSKYNFALEQILHNICMHAQPSNQPRNPQVLPEPSLCPYIVWSSSKDPCKSACLRKLICNFAAWILHIYRYDYRMYWLEFFRI